MGEEPGAVSASVTEQRGDGQPPDDPQRLRAEIERTRLELGDTVAALAEKTDVKARAKEKAAEVRENVTQKRAELVGRAREASPEGTGSVAAQARAKAQDNPVPTAAIAAFVAGLLLGRITSGR